MRHMKIIVLFTALLLCICLTAAALSDSPASALWDSGCDLLFHTDNVTVTGEASFSLDGEHFKTAKLNYVQDGYRSFYGLRLLSPRPNGTLRETGWTIVAGEEGDIYSMEVLEPGACRVSFATPNNTLLRRSVELDALMELGGLLVKQTAPLLPEGVITAGETEDGLRTVHIAVAQDQLPDVALSALNLGFSFLSDRWFSYGHDRTYVEDDMGQFENYVSITTALAAGTVHWTLRGADILFTLDAQDHLTAAEGALRVASTFWDESVREVEVKFSLAMTDWGNSHVEPFNPEDYGVSMPVWWDDGGEEVVESSLTDEEWEALKDRSVALLKAQDYPMDEIVGWGGWSMPDGYTYMEIECPEGRLYDCVYDLDGGLVILDNLESVWYESEEMDADDLDSATKDAALALLRSFLAEQNAVLAEDGQNVEVEGQYVTEDGSRYLSMHDPLFSVYCVLRVDPGLRIEYFDGTPVMAE